MPLAFVPCRQVRSGETPSPLVVLQGLQDFTPTPEVPLTSPGLEQTVSPESPTVELLDFPRDLSGRLQTL